MERKTKEQFKRLVPAFAVKVYHNIRVPVRNIHIKAYGALNKGDRFTCPFCEESYNRFLPSGTDVPVIKEKKIIGAGKRDNVLCPGCQSTDRERLLFLFLQKKKYLLKKGSKVLHIAPEANLKRHFIGNGVDYLNADNNPKLADTEMDITAIEHPDERFDAIICNHVLEHIPDDRLAMRELYRILKLGGWAILQVPISQKLTQTTEDPSVTDPVKREQLFGQFDHVRIYGKDYTDRLQEAGFNVEALSCSALFDQEIINRYSLISEETIFLCKKI